MSFEKFENPSGLTLDTLFSRIENEVEFPVKKSLIKEIRQIFKDLGTKCRKFDLMKFSLSDLKSFRDRLYQKVLLILDVKSSMKFKNEEYVEETISLNPLNCKFGCDFERGCFDDTNYDDLDFDIPGYSLCSPDDKSRNDSSYNKILEAKTFVQRFGQYFESSSEVYDATLPMVVPVCQKRNKFYIGTWPIEYENIRKNVKRKFIPSHVYKILSEIQKGYYVPVYRENVLFYCPKKDLFSMFMDEQIDFRPTKELIMSLSKDQIMKINRKYGNKDDPYPFGFCWLNLFSPENHKFLIEIYDPFITSENILLILNKHGFVKLANFMENRTFYEISEEFGHYSKNFCVRGNFRKHMTAPAWQLIPFHYAECNSYADQKSMDYDIAIKQYVLLKRSAGFENSAGLRLINLIIDYNKQLYIKFDNNNLISLYYEFTPLHELQDFDIMKQIPGKVKNIDSFECFSRSLRRMTV